MSCLISCLIVLPLLTERFFLALPQPSLPKGTGWSDSNKHSDVRQTLTPAERHGGSVQVSNIVAVVFVGAVSQ